MGVLMGSGALMLWLDVAPQMDRETDAWYIDEHMPERIDLGGYLRARRYSAIEGSPGYLTLFEAHTPAALSAARDAHDEPERNLVVWAGRAKDPDEL